MSAEQPLLRASGARSDAEDEPTPSDLRSPNGTELEFELGGDVSFHRKVGCARCNETGYRGRIGIFQLMVMSEELARLAAQSPSHTDLQDAALSEGMGPLWQDDMDKVMQGLTTIEELHRVL